MSQENVEIVRAIFAAWKARDARTAQGYLDPNLEYDTTNLSFLGQLAGSKTGSEGLQQMVADWLDAFESLEFAPENFIDGGDHVLVTLRVLAQGKGSGAPVEAPITIVYSLRNGLVVGFRACESLAAAASAVGV